jgi:hypothetical protein
MSRREIAFRLRSSLLTHAQRATTHFAAPRWDRRALRRALDGRCLDVEGQALLARGDWSQLDGHLRASMRRRPSRFVLQPGDAASTARAIVDRWPSAPANAAHEADRILAGRYDLLGYTDLALPEDPASIDWHRDPVHGRTAPRRFWADVPFLDPACGDHKIIWELNRHQHFLRLGRAFWLTGDRRYADRIVDEVHGWLHDNPPLRGINWASMLELGFRALSWVAAIHFLLGADSDTLFGSRGVDEPWLLDMCLALDRQLAHVDANLSYYFSPNTHLTGEALALYVAGTTLPELAGSRRWAAHGRTVLLHEVTAQIRPDGGHIERSTHYHRYTLDFYTLAWQTATIADDGHAAAVFRDAVDRLATYMRAMTDVHGRMPPIGDDDGGLLWPIAGRDPRDVRDSLSLAAVLLGRADLTGWDVPEEVYWLAPAVARTGAAAREERSPRPPAVSTQLFPDTGFAAVRTSGGDHLVLDAAPHGFGNGGHAHADALSITLSLAGRPLLIDPGTATYTMDSVLRDSMRSSLLHNTVTIDRRSSAQPDGPFRWSTVADAQVDRWRASARVAFVQASHDGYAPLAHRRTVVHGCGGWLIVDEVSGTGIHHAEARWHFDPDWEIQLDGVARVRAGARDGASAFLCVDAGAMHLMRGAADRQGGWASPRYGMLLPTTTVSVERELREGDAMVTWIGTRKPHAVRQMSTGEPGAHGATVEWDGARVVTMLRRASHGVGRVVSTEDGVRTDGRFLQYSRGADQATVALFDGSRAEVDDSRLLSVVCDDVVQDLYAEFDGVTLEVCASRPPAVLRIGGAGAERAHRLTLNGVEVRAARAEGGHVITVRAADWPATVSAVPGEPVDSARWHVVRDMPSAQPATS